MNNTVVIKSLLARVFLILIFVSALAASVFGQAVLVADSHVSTTSSKGNFGTNPALTISSTSTTYVKFKILRSSLAGKSSTDVARATVKFYVNKVTTPGKLDVYPITTDWDEKTISANNAPRLGPLAFTTPLIGKDTQGNYFLIDVTELVKRWIGDGSTQTAPNYGIALASHPVDADTPQLAELNFDSKENSLPGHDAALNVQLVGASELPRVGTLNGDDIAANLLSVADEGVGREDLASVEVTNSKIAMGPGTSNQKLHFLDSVYIDGAFGLVLKSFSGSCWVLTVSNQGALTVMPVTCP